MICIDQKTGDRTTEPLCTQNPREFHGLYLGQVETNENNRYINYDNNVIVQKLVTWNFYIFRSYFVDAPGEYT